MLRLGCASAARPPLASSALRRRCSAASSANSASAAPYAHLKVKELRRFLAAAGVDSAGIFERRDLEAAWAALSDAQRLAAAPPVATPSLPSAAAAEQPDGRVVQLPPLVDDPVEKLCRALGESLARHGVQAGCVLGSVMLYQVLSERGLSSQLTRDTWSLSRLGPAPPPWSGTSGWSLAAACTTWAHRSLMQIETTTRRLYEQP